MTRYRTIVADPPWAYEGFASQPGDPRRTEAASGRLLCQVCGRQLVPLKDGTARRHGRYGGCQGSGYRMERWPVGQQLRHHAGDRWEITADIGGRWGDYQLECLWGREKGRIMRAHGEYMHRHGWEAMD